MRAALTGTPGVGKTTVARVLSERGYEVHALGSLVEEGLNLGRDEERDSLLADLDALEERLRGERGVLEGHLSHLLDVDVAVVLRCDPRELERRGGNRENLEAEALDVVLQEAVERCDEVHEVDATDLSPEEAADRVEAALEGREEFPPGSVDWTDWLMEA